jgi:two-component sensor histidine kinase
LTDPQVKIKEIEGRINELSQLHEELHQFEKEQLDENDVHAIIDQYLIEKGYITESQLQNLLYKNKVTTMKWVIGTGLSIATITISIISLFL